MAFGLLRPRDDQVPAIDLLGAALSSIVDG